MFLRWLTPGLVLLTAAAVHTVDGRLAPATDGAVAGRPPPAAAGLRVVMDPATGEIVARPTADDVTALGPSWRGERRRSDELELFDLPSGARGVVLEGWADHAMRVGRAADGTLRPVCSRGDRHPEVR